MSTKEDIIDRPPDGGALAWSVVIGAWCTSFCSFGWLNSVGIFQEYYQRNLLKQYSASTISWIPSLQVFFMLASAPPIGFLYDRYGPRYIVFVGTFLHVFGLMMTSISKEYYQILLSQGVCSAIGAAAIFQPALSSVSGWFDTKRATAFGILSTGSSTGGVIFPIMVTHLIDQVGYGWAMRIAAFIILFLLVIANLTVKTRLPPQPQGITAQDLSRPLREPPLVTIMGAYAILTFGVYIPINYLVVSATEQGMSVELSQYLVPILNAASFFGRFGTGVVADRLGRYNVFIFVCAMTGILILALWIPASSNAPSIVFAALFGFSSGAYVSLSPALIAQISPLKEFGYRNGLMYLSGAIPGLVTSPIAGAILARDHGSFTGVKIYGGVFCLVGTVLVVVARLMKTGPKLFAKF
ncbi:MCT family MFS transporter [Aspergillus alliaceus]|uniref:MCT family MFS transporter n=1 Tax=Petromyces alliaceus TaxID=209559 RepID=UPI0012A678BC|nr:major facilitator superfamily domain-containing protein [Aspergillus alliaceus]KAB8229637.1 major facilitator superfamily domain-containing protein [Aspergillus alliaceus]